MEQINHDSSVSDPDVPPQGEFGTKNNVNDGDGMSSTNEKNVAQLDRETEKRMIREEIIRRQELEDEVRMELDMEKRIMGNYCGVSNVDHAFGLTGPRYMPNYDDYLLNLGASDDLMRGEMKPVGGQCDGNAVTGNMEKQQTEEVTLGKWPFNLHQEPRLIAGHVAEKLNAQSADVVMVEAQPTTGIAGMKRKAETSARPCDEETTPTLTQDTQQWFCSLCQVSATSELTLRSHFEGKKHKSKEARSKPDDISSSMKMPSSIADNSTSSPQAVSIVSSDDQNTAVTKKWECSVCQLSLSSEVLLISHLQGKKHKVKEAKFQASEIISKVEGFPSEKPQEVFMPESNVNATDNNKQLYCSICRVSASSLNNLNDHLKGKKHKAKAGQSQQGIINMNPEPTEKVPGVEVSEGKSFDGEELNNQLSKGEETEQEIVNENKESTENVSEVEVMKVESSDGLHIPTNEQKTSNPVTAPTKEGQTELDLTSTPLETKPDGNINPGPQGDSDGNKTQGHLSTEYVKYWHCKMCNKGTPDEAVMAAHRKSNEHMTLLKELGGGVISLATVSKEALRTGGLSSDELTA